MDTSHNSISTIAVVPPLSSSSSSSSSSSAGLMMTSISSSSSIPTTEQSSALYSNPEISVKTNGRGQLRALVIGDMHFKENNLSIVKLMCERILWIVSTTPELDMIVLLGDTLDRFAKVHTVPWQETIVFFEKLVEFKIPTYLLIGNHDYPNNSVYLSNVHPFYSLHKWPDITVIDKVTSVTHKGYRILLTPYVAKDRLIEACQSYSMSWYQEHDLHCGHSELQGCKMGAIKSTTTDVWKDFYCFTIEGHCHDHHVLAPNAIYIGTPMQHSNCDNGDKTISLFTVNPLDKISTSKYHKENKYETFFIHRDLQIHERRIDLDLPKHKNVYLDYNGFLQWYNLEAPPHGYDLLRVVVRAHTPDINTLKACHYQAKLKERGIKLALKEISGQDRVILEDEQKYSRIQKPKFRDLLYENVKTDPDMLEIYKKVCIVGTTPVVLSQPQSMMSARSSVVILED